MTGSSATMADTLQFTACCALGARSALTSAPSAKSCLRSAPARRFGSRPRRRQDSVMSSADSTVNRRSSWPPADAALPAIGRAVDIGHEPAREQRRPQPAQVRARRAGAAEAPRRQVPLEHRPREVAPADLVELRAGEAVVLAVALLFAVVDVVVAEAAEEEVRERLRAILRREAGRAAQPERRVPATAPRRPKSYVACISREDLASSRSRPRLPSSTSSLLVVHVAERRADVRARQLGAGGDQPIHLDGHVLILRQLIEVARDAAFDLERHAPRLVEDQRVRCAPGRSSSPCGSPSSARRDRRSRRRSQDASRSQS